MSEASTVDESRPANPVDELEATLEAIRAGRLPDERQLTRAMSTGAGAEKVLHAFAALGTEDQVIAATKVGLLAFSPAVDQQVAATWVQGLAEKVRNRADLLVRLVAEMWQYADASAALAELRSAVKRGAVTLAQRTPVPVAGLYRDLAREVGDPDALADAYEALASDPQARTNIGALLALAAELEDEVVGTEGERQAVELRILLAAYGVADEAELLRVAHPAIVLTRALLRQDPPNTESARKLQPLLQHAAQVARDGDLAEIDAVLRELEGPPNRPLAEASPAVILTIRDVLNYAAGLTSNLEILDVAYESGAGWGKNTHKYIGPLMKSMDTLKTVADAWSAGEIGPDGLFGAFRDQGQNFVRKDSDQTRQRHAERYIVRGRDGSRVVLESHLRLGNDFRVYIAFDKARRHILVGHVGEHFPTGRPN